MDRSKLNRLFTILFVLSAGTFWGFLVLSLSHIDRGEPALSFLRPAIDLIVLTYHPFESQPQLLYTKVLPAVAALWCLCAVAAWITGKKRALGVCFLLLPPMLAESAVLLRQVNVGIVLHIISFLILAGVYTRLKILARPDDEKLPWRAIEIPLFLLLLVLLCILRFYLIDRVPTSWDTEMCVDRHVFFRSVFDVMRHEAGWDPKTTLGGLWLFLHVLLGHLDEPDNYYVYLRLLGIGISVLKFFIVFCCVRALCGSFAAFTSIIFLGFGPPEDWWAREPSFHHLPGLIAVLIFWATARALEKRRFRDFILVSVLTGLARMVYASGIFLAFAPLSFFLLLLTFRWREWKNHVLEISTLFLGAAFWLLWRSIAYWYIWGIWIWRAPVEIPYHTELHGGILDKLYTVFVVNGINALSTIVLHQVNPTHWTVALTTAPARSVASMVLVLSILGLVRIVTARGGRLGVLLLIFIGWALFSGVTTQVADRRVGAVFVFLNILAAREAALILSFIRSGGQTRVASLVSVMLPTIALVYLGLMGTAFRFKYEGIPYQVTRSRLIRDFLEPNTIFVLLSVDHGCNAFYGVYRELKSCKMGWVQPQHDGPFSIDAAISNPIINPESWVYTQTDLGACLSTYPANWQQVVFLFVEDQNTPELLEKVRIAYPSGSFHRKQHTDPNGIIYSVSAYKLPLAAPQ